MRKLHVDGLVKRKTLFLFILPSQNRAHVLFGGVWHANKDGIFHLHLYFLLEQNPPAPDFLLPLSLFFPPLLPWCRIRISSSHYLMFCQINLCRAEPGGSGELTWLLYHLSFTDVVVWELFCGCLRFCQEEGSGCGAAIE